jgi:hypothetical protein
LQPTVHALGFLPREQDLGRGSGEHRQGRTDRNRVAQAGRAFGGRDADAVVALAAEQLSAFAGCLSESGKDWARCRKETILAGRGGELSEPRTENEPAVQVSGHHPVVLEGNSEPVRSGSGETGGVD